MIDTDKNMHIRDQIAQAPRDKRRHPAARLSSRQRYLPAA